VIDRIRCWSAGSFSLGSEVRSLQVGQSNIIADSYATVAERRASHHSHVTVPAGAMFPMRTAFTQVTVSKRELVHVAAISREGMTPGSLVMYLPNHA
jgi:tmRNA-binding protein